MHILTCLRSFSCPDTVPSCKLNSFVNPIRHGYSNSFSDAKLFVSRKKTKPTNTAFRQLHKYRLNPSISTLLCVNVMCFNERNGVHEKNGNFTYFLLPRITWICFAHVKCYNWKRGRLFARKPKKRKLIAFRRERHNNHTSLLRPYDLIKSNNKCREGLREEFRWLTLNRRFN